MDTEAERSFRAVLDAFATFPAYLAYLKHVQITPAVRQQSEFVITTLRTQAEEIEQALKR